MSDEIAKRRLVAALADTAILLLMQLPLHFVEYVSAWSGPDASVDTRRAMLIVAATTLWMYSAMDVIAETPGKLLMRVAILGPNGERARCSRRILRWGLKWWWILLSPVLFDRFRPSGSAFWCFGSPPPEILEQHTAGIAVGVGAWIAVCVGMLFSARSRTLYDWVSGTSVGCTPVHQCRGFPAIKESNRSRIG